MDPRDYEGATVPFDAHRARAKREDQECNRLRTWIERLPPWMSEIEKAFWHLPWIGSRP